MDRQWTTTEYNNLYQVSDTLSKENKITLGLLMPVNVYVQDPFVAEQNNGVALSWLHVPAEPELMDGPTSARIAVVDYDGYTNRLEKPAKWDAKNRRFVFDHKGKLEPVTKDCYNTPQFHQVNVWAVIQSILDIYEPAWVLGRSVPWAFEDNRLIVVPHAGCLANAFYDRRSKSIQFYYFGPEDRRVYTCLSHDIIAHETGHAILDGLRPLCSEDSSLQTTAFHEFVANLTAIMASLLNNGLRWQWPTQFEGEQTQDAIVSSLAEEFGQYAAGRPYLRSAQNAWTIDDVSDSSSHDRSDVLTGAMFDIFKGMVAKYLQKQLYNDRGPFPKQALNWAVNRFRRTVLQPLDYLPPFDVQFSDYAQAVLAADRVVDPVNQDGYRDLMRNCFARRGIKCPAKEEEQDRVQFFASDIDRISGSRTDAYHFLNDSRRQLCIPAEQDVAVVDLYQTDKAVMGGARLPREVVLQYGWREDVKLTGSGFGPLAGTTASLLCGGAIVLDSRGSVLSWIRKPGVGKQEPDRRRRRRYCDDEREKGEQRRKELVAYIKSRVDQGLVGLVERDRPEEIGAGRPVVASLREDGTVRLEVTPHLRHWMAGSGEG